MTIDKAIESLSNLLKRYDFIDAHETHQAVQLGIEALKAVGQWNEHQMPQHQFHLSGETKD